jgi:hypothetical protein
MNFRASSDPLYLACPGAAHPAEDEILINRNDDAGTVGTATHEILADWLVDDTQDLDVYIQRYNLSNKDARDCKILAAVGRIFWLEWAVGADAEVIVERPGDAGFSVIICEDEWTGHTDILVITADTIFVVDWKTTRIPYKDYGPQMKRYCWHAANKYPHIDKFEYVIVFLRDGTCEISQPLTREDLDDYHADFLDTVLNWDGKTYCPGGNCHYCPRTLGCREKISFMQNMLAIFDEEPAGVLDNASDAQCVSLYQKIGAVQNLMIEAKENIKARCTAMDNMSLEGDEGVNLVISDTVKQAFDMSLARPVLLKYMKPDQLDACCKLGKTLMLDTVSASAPRGKKKEAKLLVMAALKEAKAYEETTTYRIGLKKATKVVESKEIV